MIYDKRSFLAGLRTGLALPRVAKPKLKIVGWPTGTDAEIAAMVAALDSGEITIEDTGWQIGEERTVYLSAMAATGVGESHAAQTAKLVLMDSGHYTLAEPTAAGRTTDHFVVGLKDCLNEEGYMDSYQHQTQWRNCERRTWCNQVFRMAIPDALRLSFKQFNVLTGHALNVVSTDIDYFALFDECEVTGYHYYAYYAAGVRKVQYYQDSNNRVKRVNGSRESWWQRSDSQRAPNFCSMSWRGTQSSGNDSNTSKGIAPFGCI